MPKEKDLTACIPKIYKCNAENIMLFTWVNAQKQIVPTVTLNQAIRNYFRFAGIYDWDLSAAIATFGRLQKEFYDDCKG
jgi:hypothetical protein